jgi:small ligand-binding sensory domain FIST
MRFHSAVSEAELTTDAVAEVVDETQAALGDRVDVVFVYFTAHHRDAADDLVERVWLELDPQTVVGCSAEGVIGADREVERAPGLAVLAGEMPGVRLHPFHVSGEGDWRDLLGDRDLLAERLGHGPQTRAFIASGDPFTTPLTPFLSAVDEMAPGVPLVGGMASSGRSPGGNVLVRNDQVFDHGLVGLSLSGPLDVETVVSQGTRPIGRPMVVTRSRENVIEQLGGRPAFEMLRETMMAMPEAERELLRRGLLLGRAISEYRETFGRGDFLVRNVIGMNQENGSVAVADYVRTGQTVQFHVRDRDSADEDLSQLLDPQRRKSDSGDGPAGGLLFSCNGRGTRLFEEPCHDISTARRAMPRTPMAGFFAAGEFGPVGGKNFIHGHTASFALFGPKEERKE